MTSAGPYVGFNQATCYHADPSTLLEFCAGAGVTHVGLWRERLVNGSATRTRAVMSDLGLEPSSLCRAGFFTDGPDAAIHDRNLRALDEAATLGAPTLVLVCGGASDGDIAAAEARTARGIEALAPVAQDLGVVLAVEVFHPMFASARSAITTISQALKVIDQVPRSVAGLAVDTYHVWFRRDIVAQLERAAEATVLVQVADWSRDTREIFESRVLPGDGIAPLRAMLSALFAGGYAGCVEVEVLSRELSALPMQDVIPEAVDRTKRLVSAAGASHE